MLLNTMESIILRSSMWLDISFLLDMSIVNKQLKNTFPKSTFTMNLFPHQIPIAILNLKQYEIYLKKSNSIVG